MYPLLYEAMTTLRTTKKDAALAHYLNVEYGGTAPAWLFVPRTKAVRRARRGLGRRLAARVRIRRPRPEITDSETSAASAGG